MNAHLTEHGQTLLGEDREIPEGLPIEEQATLARLHKAQGMKRTVERNKLHRVRREHKALD